MKRFCRDRLVFFFFFFFPFSSSSSEQTTGSRYHVGEVTPGYASAYMNV
jgi:hypothetical protein